MAPDKHLAELLDLVVKEAGSDLHLFAGGPPVIATTGGVVSATVTVKVAGFAALPAASAALHVTVDVPNAR